MHQYDEALAIAADLFHITRGPRHDATKMTEKDKRRFVNGIRDMLWKAMKEQVEVADDLAAAAHFAKRIAGLDMPPEGPPTAQDREEFIAMVQEMVWTEVYCKHVK